jgi:hypothetical protein
MMIILLDEMINKELLYYYDRVTEKQYEHKSIIVGFSYDFNYVFLASERQYKGRIFSDYLKYHTILHKCHNLGMSVFRTYVGGLVAVGGVHKEFKQIQQIIFNKRDSELLCKQNTLLNKLKQIDETKQSYADEVQRLKVYEVNNE